MSHSRDSAIGGSREYFFKINKVYLIAATRYAILMLKKYIWGDIMQNKKRFLSVIALWLLLARAITSCVGVSPEIPDVENGEENETNTNTGTENTKDPTKIYLVENGVVNFSFVYSFTEFSDSFRTHIFSSISSLHKKGITAEAVRDDLDAHDTEYEVLIGTFVGREDATVSKYILGNKGYTIRVIGNRIVILGGTEESLKIAFDLFVSQYLSFDTGTRNVTLDRDHNKTVREVYDITSLSIGGTELSDGGFKLVCDPNDRDAIAAARIMQVRMYDSAGYYLDIVARHDGPAIRISTAERSDKDGFRVYTTDGSLYIECQYPELFEAEMEKFLCNAIKDSAEGAVEIGNSYSKNMHTISYFDCGAVGDGVTDDFYAIKEAHTLANTYGLKINACGERYGEKVVFHLGAHAESIQIMTDTDWTGAEFIVDDTLYDVYSNVRTTNIFTVVSSITVNTQLRDRLVKLSKDATNIGFTLDQDYLVILYNNNVKQYIRYGNNADSGAAQQEVILVHANGDIDESTPLLWNYDTITDVRMYPASDVGITISGGTFITVANRAPKQYNYYERNIKIMRSNVTVTGLTHLIEGEGDTGAPYSGFLSVAFANNVLFENIVYTGHKTYKLETDSSNSMGSYDISASNSNAVTWKNCTQSNSITDSTRWGIMGSNYCKNLKYDGCKLSRFDAHKGMYNSTIVNSEIGHGGISAIGAGYLLIENTTVNHNNVVHLRSDYGSTWDGEIIIKDVTLKNTSTSPTVISASWYDHYFGYTCHLPNVIIDNLTVSKGTKITVFPSFSSKNIASTSTNNPVAIGGKITVRNNKNGYSYTVSSNNYIKNAITLTTE